MMKRKQIIAGICGAIVLLLLVYLAALIGGNTDKTDAGGTLPAGTATGEDRTEDELGGPEQTTEQSGNPSPEQTTDQLESMWPETDTESAEQPKTENPSDREDQPDSGEQLGSDNPSESADPSETDGDNTEMETSGATEGETTEQSQPETSGGLILPDDIF